MQQVLAGFDRSLCHLIDDIPSFLPNWNPELANTFDMAWWADWSPADDTISSFNLEQFSNNYFQVLVNWSVSGLLTDWI